MGNQVSIKEIALHAGVAVSTVSRVLNNVATAYPVAQATRDKIFSAVKELNYIPNINARRLSQNKSYAVALVIPTLDNLRDQYTVFEDFSFMEAMQGIEQALYSSDYRLTLIFRNQRFMDEKEYLRLFNERTVDGMLIWGALATDTFPSELGKHPHVQVNSYSRLADSGIYVGINHRQGAFLVGDKLLAQGRRRILYIAGKEDVSISDDHRQGYLDALAVNGLSLIPELFFRSDSFNPQSVDAIIDSVLACDLRFDAVFCVNDNFARACRRRLQERAPSLVASLAFGGGGLAANLVEREKYAGICTYQCPYAAMGKHAMQLLLSWLESGRPEENFALDTTLVC